MDRAADAVSGDIASDRATSISLLARLRNWWNGVDATVSADEVAPATAEPKAEAPTEAGLPGELDEAAWSVERMAAAEAIFSGDCRSPLGPAEVLDMVRHVALNDKMAVLDLGAGLGAAARMLNSQLGVWVTGLDPSRKLAEEGMRRSKEAGLGRKVPVQSYDVESIELPERKYDCVYAREIF